jgi:hypothetical protein
MTAGSISRVWRPRSITARPIGFGGWQRTLFVAALLCLAPPAANADALDAVPLDTRARLTVAASAYPPQEEPRLDPENPDFAPNLAADYLLTNEDGHYAASTFRGPFEVHFTLIRFADEKASAAGLEAWKATGDSPVPLDWGGDFAMFRRGQGLLGISMLGAGSVARGHSGRWHFEVSATPQGNSPGGGADADEIAILVEATRTLAANASRYRIFPRELVVEYAVAGDLKRLAKGHRLQVPLKAGEETMARFRLQVLDDGNPVESIAYTLEIGGALADVAELIEGGSKSKRTIVEANSPDGAPVEIAFVFPPATSENVARLVDAGDLSLSLAVEARTAPTVLP